MPSGRAEAIEVILADCSCPLASALMPGFWGFQARCCTAGGCSMFFAFTASGWILLLISGCQMSPPPNIWLKNSKNWLLVCFMDETVRRYFQATPYHNKPESREWDLLKASVHRRISPSYNPLYALYIFITARCNVEINNDVDNQQFTHWNSESGVEVVLILSQHD